VRALSTPAIHQLEQRTCRMARRIVSGRCIRISERHTMVEYCIHPSSHSSTSPEVDRVTTLFFERESGLMIAVPDVLMLMHANQMSVRTAVVRTSRCYRDINSQGNRQLLPVALRLHSSSIVRPCCRVSVHPDKLDQHSFATMAKADTTTSFSKLFWCAQRIAASLTLIKQ